MLLIPFLILFSAHHQTPSHPLSRLRLGLESRRIQPDIPLNRSLIPQELHIRPINLDFTLLPHGNIVVPPQGREPPILAHNDLLPSGELVLRAAKGLDGGGAVVVARADAEEDLADVDAGDGAVGLAPGAAHAGLQPIGAGAGQHLVDADDVVRVGADAHVESFFAGGFDEVSMWLGCVSFASP